MYFFLIQKFIYHNCFRLFLIGVSKPIIHFISISLSLFLSYCSVLHIFFFTIISINIYRVFGDFCNDLIFALFVICFQSQNIEYTEILPWLSRNCHWQIADSPQHLLDQACNLYCQEHFYNIYSHWQCCWTLMHTRAGGWVLFANNTVFFSRFF